MGSLIGGVAGMVEGRKGAKAMQAALAEARALAEKSVREYEAIGIPTVEAQRLALQKPEVVGLLEAYELEPSELENVMTDPRMQEKQREALAGLEEIAEEGFTEEDKARYEAMLGQAAGEEQARQESILQSMAERGALDSGAQLAAQLASAQSDTGDARQQALDMMAQSAQARRQAMQQVGQMAGNLEETDFRRQRDAALAADEISRFNLANRQDVARQNLGTRQRISEAGTDIANRQQQYNKALLQQQYQNQMQKQQAIANARAGVQSAITNQGQAQMQASQQRAQAFGQIGSGLDQAGMAAAGAFGGPSTGIGRMGMMSAGINPYAKANGGIKYANGGLANMQEYSDEEKLNEYETLKQLGVVGATGYACGGTKKDKYAGGGYEKMGYEEGGPQTSGRIVPGDEFAGDKLPDRINSGEAVLNVDMQQRILDKLRELRQLRTDEMIEIGEAEINPEAQQELIDISRGDLPLEQADLSENVVKPTEKGMARLMKMLGME